MRTFVLGFLAAVIAVPLGAAGYLRLGLADMQSDTSPPKWEEHVMRDAVRASVGRSAAGLSMHATSTVQRNERLVEGGKLFMRGCAGCHGELGKPFATDTSNYPPVPQLPHVGTNYTEPQIYWVVKHGIRMTAMSAYGSFYSEDQLWSIAVFLHDIRNLPPGVQERILAKTPSAGADQ